LGVIMRAIVRNEHKSFDIVCLIDLIFLLICFGVLTLGESISIGGLDPGSGGEDSVLFLWVKPNTEVSSSTNGYLVEISLAANSPIDTCRIVLAKKNGRYSYDRDWNSEGIRKVRDIVKKRVTSFDAINRRAIIVSDPSVSAYVVGIVMHACGIAGDMRLVEMRCAQGGPE
jgi:hypothetical protein